ncbi:coenzyme A pyrophosphatase [Hoyosella rhizosphaerae]|uniref:Coenzyme A pyrophosphatase n=1 Tax=Hoyosella rhizosphaerae TaxID=1755582 RepID=A0A916U422_9ACTN|nr:coenzyme A pyrophosphatase [Hoyosella rhizosphaerae]
MDAPGMQAATALIITEQTEPRVLLIRRAVRDGDRWSGHAALPGGKVEPSDGTRIDTARREAAEETGITGLSAVGAMDDIKGWFRTGVVTPVVFTVAQPQALVIDQREVAEADWVPLQWCASRQFRARYPYPLIGPWSSWAIPFGTHGEQLVVWGLTYRILSNFIALCR